jgi:hypothetical protein
VLLLCLISSSRLVLAERSPTTMLPHLCGRQLLLPETEQHTNAAANINFQADCSTQQKQRLPGCVLLLFLNGSSRLVKAKWLATTMLPPANCCCQRQSKQHTITTAAVASH